MHGDSSNTQQAALYLGAARAAVDRVRENWSGLLPEGTLSQPGSGNYAKESDEILHALLGCGMNQLDAIGNPEYERALRRATLEFCGQNGCRVPLVGAYEKVWAAGADDLEKASRVGGMLVSCFKPKPPAFWIPTLVTATGAYLWGDAAVLWKQVDDYMMAQLRQSARVPK